MARNAQGTASEGLLPGYETVVITKRGKPFVEVVSFRSPGRKAIPGKLAHTLVSESDIVSPLGAAQWDAAR